MPHSFEVFGLTEAFVENMEKFESPCLDKFLLSDLKTSEYGNNIYDSGENSTVHDIFAHPLTVTSQPPHMSLVRVSCSSCISGGFAMTIYLYVRYKTGIHYTGW